MTVLKNIIGLSIILLLHNIFIFGQVNNGKNEPEPFLCYECDGKTNTTCTQNVIDRINLTSCTTKCFTKTDEEGRNIRGCLTGEESNTCPEINSCQTCNVTKCNDKTFPENRTECYICEGDNCKIPSNNIKLFCENYNIKDNKCYTYFDSDVNIIRGCTSKKHQLCEKNPEYCIECENKADNIICNSVTNLTCFKCDNEKDCKRPAADPSRSVENCEININKYENCTIDQGNDMNLCYIQKTSNNIIARGCATDKKNEIIEGLTYCKGQNCNKECIEDIECPICEENNDPTCSKNENQTIWYNKKCDASATVCHTCLNSDGLTIRGCGKPSDNLKHCNFCYTNKCIAPVSHSCYKCDKTDPKCSRLPTISNIRTETCDKNITKCFTKLNTDNYIERGCANSNEICENSSDDKCKICNTNNCNIDIMPANRRLCYQCDSKTLEGCNEIKDSNIEAYPCEIYKENDKCYTTYNDTHKMIRGCNSDLLTDPNRQECETNLESCIHCDEDKCNNLPYKITKLLCIQCNHNESNCVWSHDTATAKSCQSTEFWKNESCFTYIDSITNVTRGCTLDDKNKDFDCKENKSDKKCTKCYTNGCNNENYGKQTCYRCRSDAPGQTECSNNKLKNIKPSECRNSVVDPKDQGCFTEKYNGVIFRGCLVDLDPETKAKCSNDTYKDCIYCTSLDCNGGKVPGGYSTVHTISFMVLISSYILYLIV